MNTDNCQDLSRYRTASGITKSNCQDLVGMSLEDATKAIVARNGFLRIARNDGHVTLEYCSSRVNVAVDKGKVTEIFSVG